MSEEGVGFAVSFASGERGFEAPIGMPLLRAAREAGLVMPSSCRNGTCRACRCRVRSGRARHTIEWPGLSADERAEGWILPCVAVAETALVIESAHFGAA